MLSGSKDHDLLNYRILFFLGSERSDMLTTVVVRVRPIQKIVGAVVETLITKGEFLRNGIKMGTKTGGGIEERGGIVEIGEAEVEKETGETEIEEIMIEIEIKRRAEKAREIGIEKENEKETEINLEIGIVGEMTTEKIGVVLLRHKGLFM